MDKTLLIDRGSDMINLHPEHLHSRGVRTNTRHGLGVV